MVSLYAGPDDAARLFGVGGALRLSHTILAPVRQLTTAITSLAAGDLDAVVHVTSADEIETLSTTNGRYCAALARRMCEGDAPGIALTGPARPGQVSSEHVAFARANLIRLLDGQDEDSTIANLPGSGRPDDRPDDLVEDRLVGDDLDHHLREERDVVFSTPVDGRVPFCLPGPLTSVTVNPETFSCRTASTTSSTLFGRTMHWINFMLTPTRRCSRRAG